MYTIGFQSGTKVFTFLRQPRWRIMAGLVVSASAALLAIASSGGTSQAAANLSCSPNGYIFKYQSGTDTAIQSIDMVTGHGSSAGAISSAHFNAVGYNPKDNYFYGWDLDDLRFGRVDANNLSSATPIQHYNNADIGFPGGQPISNFFSGDVDEDGYHWTFEVSGGTTTWYKINLNTTPNPTYVTTGTAPNPSIAGKTITNGTDWAYVPGSTPSTGKLYRAMDNTTDNRIEIFAFDPNATGSGFTHVGTVSNVLPTSNGDMGAVYADPDGNFYMSSHNSGRLFQIDLSDAPSFTAVQLDAADTNSNDGARCSLASVPVDFGDAPAGYDTLIDNDGPRHSIIDFNTASSTAPLMLGTHVDIENDAFSSAGANGDDNDHEGLPGGPFVDDERGVTQIVAVQGSSDPLIVPVRVTNTSSGAATLAGWIDLDNSGSFDGGERVTASVPSGFNGSRQLAFPAPSSPYSANTYARFRLFSTTDTSLAATNLLPTGPALGGEVEDVLVQMGSYDASKTADPAEGGTVDPGSTVTYTLTLKNTGPTALANLKIDDDLTDVLDDAVLQGTPQVTPSSAGTAAVDGNTLEFSGDLSIGGTVTVTYSVKIKDAAVLGNAALNNLLLAAHSASCHPQVAGNGTRTVDDPDCKTNHVVGGLANTGTSIFLPLVLAGGLLAAGGAVWYFGMRRTGAKKSA